MNNTQTHKQHNPTIKNGMRRGRGGRECGKQETKQKDQKQCQIWKSLKLIIVPLMVKKN
jgi:hypothetical protein